MTLRKLTANATRAQSPESPARRRQEDPRSPVRLVQQAGWAALEVEPDTAPPPPHPSPEPRPSTPEVDELLGDLQYPESRSSSPSLSSMRAQPPTPRRSPTPQHPMSVCTSPVPTLLAQTTSESTPSTRSMDGPTPSLSHPSLSDSSSNGAGPLSSHSDLSPTVPSSFLAGPYLLRPRPTRPPTRHLSSLHLSKRRPRIIPRKTTRLPHNEPNPACALLPSEEQTLGNLLSVPVSLWSRAEREYIRAMSRTLRRAARDQLGRGEEVKIKVELDDYPMAIDDDA